MQPFTISEKVAELIRSYLDFDCQMHLRASGKWSLDMGKFVAALEEGGVTVDFCDDSREEQT